MCILGKEDMIAVRDLWKVTGVKKILILRILQDSVPSLLPLHINMEKIQDFPGCGKLLTEK